MEDIAYSITCCGNCHAARGHAHRHGNPADYVRCRTHSLLQSVFGHGPEHHNAFNLTQRVAPADADADAPELPRFLAPSQSVLLHRAEQPSPSAEPYRSNYPIYPIAAVGPYLKQGRDGDSAWIWLVQALGGHIVEEESPNSRGEMETEVFYRFSPFTKGLYVVVSFSYKNKQVWDWLPMKETLTSVLLFGAGTALVDTGIEYRSPEIPVGKVEAFITSSMYVATPYCEECRSPPSSPEIDDDLAAVDLDELDTTG